jgi:PAS domain S-box-containing protein
MNHQNKTKKQLIAELQELYQINSNLKLQHEDNISRIEAAVNSKKSESGDFSESKEYFELIFNTSPDAALISRVSDAKVLKVNDAFTKISGYSREEALNSSTINLDLWKYPDDRSLFINKLIKHGTFDNLETVFVRKNGTTFSGLISAKTFLYNGVPHIFSITRDISKRKQTEDALKKSEEKYRNLFEKSQVGKFRTRLDGTKVLEVNEKLTQMLGFSREELLGNPATLRYVNPKQRDQMTSLVKRANSLNDFEAEFYTKNGTVKTLLMSVTAYPEEGVLEGSLVDITERKRAEEELVKSKVLLRKFATHLQDKLEEERVLLAAQLDNELGQILLSLKIDIGMLKKAIQRGDYDKESMSIFEKLNEAHSTIGNSIKTTLKLMNELRYEVLYLMGFVEGVKLFIADFQEKTNIKCSFDSEVEKLDIDEKQATSLFRIFQIAMSNITEHSKATEVKISLSKTVKRIVFEIADNGTGFDQKELSNPDATGLIFMKERTLLLNGTLDIRSGINEGTTIRVEIPVC